MTKSIDRVVLALMLPFVAIFLVHIGLRAITGSSRYWNAHTAFFIAIAFIVAGASCWGLGIVFHWRKRRAKIDKENEAESKPSHVPFFAKFRYWGTAYIAIGLLLIGIVQHLGPFSTAGLIMTKSADHYVVTAPDSQLTLTLPSAGLAPSRPEFDSLSTNPRYFMLEDEGRGLNVSGWFVSADYFPGIKKFWADETAKSGWAGVLEPCNVSFVQIGSWNVILYDFEIKGMALANLRAEWVEAGTWIDIHLSKAADHPAGLREELAAFLKTLTVSVKDGKQPSYRSIDFFKVGCSYYLKRDYAKAIGLYEKALELEKQQSSLDRESWIILVDNLGMAYGISGDVKKSMQLYEWALVKEPEYPMFYFNLACGFAEMNNRDKAIENLQWAFKYKRNSLPGETVPNPRSDSSFKKYLNDPSFITELNKMK